MESEISSSGEATGHIPYVMLPRRDEGRVGALGDTEVEQAKNQTSKGWFILAIAVGILVVGAGTFGGVGLLQSHGLISLPHWLASTIGTVGNTPHFWSLWTIAVGGITVGGSLIAFGSSKIHTHRKRAEVERKAAKNKLIDSNFTKNNFKEVIIHPEQMSDFAFLKNGEYGCFVLCVEGPNNCFIVRKSPSGVFECTPIRSQKEQDLLADSLTEQKYRFRACPVTS